MDTYNLLAEGMLRLARAVAAGRGQKPESFLASEGLEALAAPSIKGAADIDWSDEAAKEGFLGGLVSDARRLMALADGSDPAVKAAGELLEQLLLQDIEERPAGADGPPRSRIKQGTARGRVPSVSDPEQRHGRKSASKRFTGHKCSVAADPETALILACDVLAGDAPDSEGALSLIAQAEDNSGCAVTETLADCAYGSGAVRLEFADAGRELLAKVPSAPAGELFGKADFAIELPDEGQSLELAKVTCPAGHESGLVSPDGRGGVIFYFDEHCQGCALRERCTKSAHGRSLHIHAQERMIQAARRLQASPDGRARLRRRLAVENALARLSHLGISKARYAGRLKSRFQLCMAAAAANLRRIWRWEAAQGALPGQEAA